MVACPGARSRLGAHGAGASPAAPASFGAGPPLRAAAGSRGLLDARQRESPAWASAQRGTLLPAARQAAPVFLGTTGL